MEIRLSKQIVPLKTRRKPLLMKRRHIIWYLTIKYYFISIAFVKFFYGRTTFEIRDKHVFINKK